MTNDEKTNEQCGAVAIMPAAAAMKTVTELETVNVDAMVNATVTVNVMVTVTANVAAVRWLCMGRPTRPDAFTAQRGAMTRAEFKARKLRQRMQHKQETVADSDSRAALPEISSGVSLSSRQRTTTRAAASARHTNKCSQHVARIDSGRNVWQPNETIS